MNAHSHTRIPSRLTEEDKRAIIALYLSEAFRVKDITREFLVRDEVVGHLVSTFFDDWPGRGVEHDRAQLRARFLEMTGEQVEVAGPLRRRNRAHWMD